MYGPVYRWREQIIVFLVFYMYDMMFVAVWDIERRTLGRVYWFDYLLRGECVCSTVLRSLQLRY